MSREDVLIHLRIMHTWATFALEKKQNFFTSNHMKNIAQWTEDALALLKEQEAVVRCKDCINCIKEPNGELYCDILADEYEPLGSKKVNGDWFCADGKPKSTI